MKLTPRQADTLAILQSVETGISRNDLAKMQDLSVDYVGDTLGELRQLGVARVVRFGMGRALWFAA